MHIKFHKNGLTREVKVGFSWTIFFFGWLTFLCRRQVVASILYIVFSLMTCGLAAIYFAFVGNRWTAEYLLEEGWTIAEGDQVAAASAYGIGPMAALSTGR